MKSLLRITFAAVAALSVMAFSVSPREAILEEMDKAISEQRWAAADSLILSALRAEPANPTNPLLFFNLGVVRYNMGRDSLALEALDIALQKVPNSLQILSNHAMVLRSLHRDDEAFSDYSKILKIDSTHTEANFYHGMMSLDRNDLATARADIARLDPESEYGLVGRAELSMLTGAKGVYEAIDIYGKLIEKWPSAEYYMRRSLCYIILERYNDASADINEAIRLSPNDGELYHIRALINKFRFRDDDAAADARRAVQLGVNPEQVAGLLK